MCPVCYYFVFVFFLGVEMIGGADFDVRDKAPEWPLTTHSE